MATLAPVFGMMDMTIFHLHHDRPLLSAGRTRFSPARVMRRMGSSFKKIRRAIAAAKIHRLRTELMLRGHLYHEWNEERCDRTGRRHHTGGAR